LDIELFVQQLHSVNTTCDSWTDSLPNSLFTPCNCCTDRNYCT